MRLPQSGWTPLRTLYGTTSCCSTHSRRKWRWCDLGPIKPRSRNSRPKPDSPLTLQFDVKARRTFLKRSFCETLTLDQLYPGNSVLVYGRQLHLRDYADQFTRKALEHQLERSATAQSTVPAAAVLYTYPEDQYAVCIGQACKSLPGDA